VQEQEAELGRTAQQQSERERLAAAKLAEVAEQERQLMRQRQDLKAKQEQLHKLKVRNLGPGKRILAVHALPLILTLTPY
jgi:hypothetical protein